MAEIQLKNTKQFNKKWKLFKKKNTLNNSEFRETGEFTIFLIQFDFI